MRTFRLVLEPDDNGTFLVTCPALPEVTSFGETKSECERNGRAAIEEALAARMARGSVIPDVDSEEIDARPDQVLFTELPALPELKVDLYQALARAGITRAELARRLEWNRTSVDRLFLLGHASKLDQIEAAAAALGLSVRAELVAPEKQRA